MFRSHECSPKMLKYCLGHLCLPLLQERNSFIMKISTVPSSSTSISSSEKPLSRDTSSLGITLSSGRTNSTRYLRSMRQWGSDLVFFFRIKWLSSPKLQIALEKIAKSTRKILLLPYFLLVSVVNYKFIILTKKKTVELVFLSMRLQFEEQTRKES